MSWSAPGLGEALQPVAATITAMGAFLGPSWPRPQLLAGR